MLRVSVIERIAVPTPEIKVGSKHFSGTFSMPLFRKAPGGSLPHSFILLRTGASAYGVPPNRVPLDEWIVASGPIVRRGGDHPDGFEHAPGFCVWEDGQENLPDAATLRRLFYRFVHTRLAKTHGGHSYTQAVAGQIFVPSNPDAPPPSE